MNWYFDVLKKYAVFSGRAGRKEYWMFQLLNFIIAICVAIVDAVLGANNLLYALYSLGILIPALAVSVRRLHDTGRSGWWLLLSLVPFGGFVVLYFLIQESEPFDNDFGPYPDTDGSTTAIRPLYGKTDASQEGERPPGA